MISKKILYELYLDQKLSMVETANMLNTTPRKVEYWLKKYSIPRRSWSESAYIKQNPNGDPFKIKRDLNQKENGLLIAGLMLFLGEGGRKNKHSIQLGNLNPQVIKVFLEFLRKICVIKEDKLRVTVRLYQKFPYDKAKIFWSELLNLPKQQVIIYRYNDPRSKIDKQWSKYGLATIQFNNMKLKKWLDNEININLAKLQG